MQKKHMPLDGLRLIVWGLILMLLMLTGALLLDRREVAAEYRDAVLVKAGDRA
ncbi:hypothetical protein LJC33_06895 [Eubacteriales bacterium OttesenSCG-928-N13]|nr:hypothetical protein [Eubacteriales bacterium OttesenSCG-928-N13]